MSIVDSEIFVNRGALDVPRHVVPTLVFDDLAVGDEWESPKRTVTESDVVAFAGISGDFNSIHLDQHSAREGPFRKPIAHGLLGLSIASGLSSFAPRVDTMAFLAIVEWKFLQPIAFGDTIHVLTKVLSLAPKARRRRGIVTWQRRILNQNGEILQEGITLTLVRNRTVSTDTDADEPEGGAGPPAESTSA